MTRELWRTLCVDTWVARLLKNVRVNRGSRTAGPLTIQEIEEQTMFWIERA